MEDVRLNKLADYGALVATRQKCRACMDIKVPAGCYQNQSDFEGIPDTDQIGNFSTWAHDLHAKVVIVGQDYANAETYRRDEGQVQRDPIEVDAHASCWSTETNYRLVQLVRELGLDIGSPSVGSATSGVFLTNAVLCLKPGKMNASNPAKVYANCAGNFLRRTIDLVQPDVVITLGLQATRATLSCYAKDSEELRHFRSLPLSALHHKQCISLSDKTDLYPVYHPGAYGRMARQRIDAERSDGWQLQLADWREIRRQMELG